MRTIDFSAIISNKEIFMKKFLFSFLGIVLFVSAADAKRYIITVENNTRVPINWDMFVSRAGGGEVVDTFDFIDGAVLDLPEEQAERLMNRRAPGMTIEEDFVINWIKDSGVSAKQSLGKYAGSSSVKNAVPAPSAAASVYENKSELAATVPMDGEFPWGIKRVNASGLWNITEGAGVKVAVIDTGINYNHEDLKENYVEGANYSGLINGLLGTNLGNPMDDQGHGTHVAGTIAAVRNGKGVVGVAPKAKLYAVKVMTKDGKGSLSAIIKGIEWAVKNKMNIANMSLGGGPYVEAMHKAVKNAVENGVTIVAAAGNDGGPVNYPAKYPETIAVSASAPNDAIAPFSSRGEEIDVMAPGMWIMSTSFDGGYVELHGTSMACPHVAGLAALAYAAGYKTPAEIRAALKKAAVPVKDLTPAEQGAGIPNAANLKK